jgi:hypothetical protein
MVHPRLAFQTALLADGTVLAVGDDRCITAGAVPGSERAEIYDPATDRWTAVGSLNKPRAAFALVPLADGGAMVLGGLNADDEPFSSTKIYSPADRTWSDGPLMVRAGAVDAVTLADGTVVAAQSGDTEILEPGAREWRRSTPPPRTAFVLGLEAGPGGSVIAIGERDDEDRGPLLLRFDPQRESWREFLAPVARPPALIAIGDDLLVLWDDMAGSHVARYDAATETWHDIPRPAEGRVRMQLTLLHDGRVLMTGGAAMVVQSLAEGNTVTEGPALATTEIYDPAANTLTAGPSLLAPRQGGHAVTLADGSVLVFGGYDEVPPDEGNGDTGDPGPCPEPLTSTERLVVGPAS